MIKRQVIKLAAIWTALLSIYSGSIDAARQASGCQTLSPCCILSGVWEAGAAAIYQQTCVQNFTVLDGITGLVAGATDQPAIQPSAIKQVNQLFDVDPQAYWGYEVWLGWRSCDDCESVNIFYKRLHSYRDSKTWVDINNFDALEVNHLPAAQSGVFTAVQGRQKTRYDTVRVRLGGLIACCCSSRLYSYFGGRYVGAEIDRSIFCPTILPPIISEVQEKTRFDGGGVEFGFNLNRCLPFGFGLRGAFGGIALFGNRQDVFSTGQFVGLPARGTEVFFSKRRITKCVPGVDLRAGLSYTYALSVCNRCLIFIGEVGWEMDYFWNILSLRGDEFGVEISTTNQAANAGNFGTSGLYLALSIAF